MSPRGFYLTFIALFSLVLAAPAPGGYGGSSQCDTGKNFCCNSLQSSDSIPTNVLSGLLGLGLGDLPVQLGLGCTPISVIGVLSGNSCTQQPACCQNVEFNGLVSLGCTPINV